MQDLGDFYKEHRANYSEEKIRSLARADALKNLPTSEATEPSPFEMELAHAYRLLASKVAGEYHGELLKLDAYIKTGQTHAEQEFTDETQRIQNQLEARRNAARNDKKVTQAREELTEAEKRFQDLHTRFGRLPIEYLPHWLYLTFAVLIFAGEIPLNALVFQIFGENQVMTWVMAGIIGLSVPLFAHFIGIKFREQGLGRNTWDIAKGTAALLIILGALYGLSEMRTTYLGEFQEDLGITPNIVKSSMFFFFLNVAVLFAAIVISYLAHDTVPGYQIVFAKYRQAKAKLQKEEQRTERELQGAEMEAVRLQNEAAQHRCTAIDQVNLAKGQHDKILREGKEHESRCQHRLGRDISVYRRENLLYRQDGKAPSYFTSEVDIVMQLASVKEKSLSETLH